MQERRPTIMTVPEVARYLRVHAITVYRMIRQGELPAIRVGRGWRFKKEDIERWLQEHEANSHGQFPTRSLPRARVKRKFRVSR